MTLTYFLCAHVPSFGSHFQCCFAYNVNCRIYTCFICVRLHAYSGIISHKITCCKLNFGPHFGCTRQKKLVCICAIVNKSHNFLWKISIDGNDAVLFNILVPRQINWNAILVLWNVIALYAVIYVYVHIFG